MRNAGNLGGKQSEGICCEISKAAITVERSLDRSGLLDRRPCRFSLAVKRKAKLVSEFCDRTNPDTIPAIESLEIPI